MTPAPEPNKNGVRRYGRWAGSSKGQPEHRDYCVVEVWTGAGYIGSQCSRKRGHGPDGKYCKQHAAKATS